MKNKRKPSVMIVVLICALLMCPISAMADSNETSESLGIESGKLIHCDEIQRKIEDYTIFDTRAYLYKETSTSNGETLYMYEIARDDDGGTNYNFKIRLSLSPGTYYLRVRACNPAITGNYYLNYKKG